MAPGHKINVKLTDDEYEAVIETLKAAREVDYNNFVVEYNYGIEPFHLTPLNTAIKKIEGKS